MIDRKRPRYRLFDLTDQPDGRAQVWYEVGVDHTPGNECSEEVSAILFEYVNAQPWKHLFWAAFVKNMKATIYEPLPF